MQYLEFGNDDKMASCSSYKAVINGEDNRQHHDSKIVKTEDLSYESLPKHQAKNV